jgi:ribonuclease R
MELRGAAVEKVEFHRSLIRSDARLTYPQVDAVFAGAERAGEPWAAPLALARAAASDLAERRDALEVGSSEPSFEFDDDGHVVALHSEEQTESHRLIEQLMVLANEQVAGYLADRRLPTLYRVHERPDPTAVAFMVEQLASLEVPTPPLPEQMTPQQAAEVATEASRLAAEYSRGSGRGRHAFGTLVLRSLKQAFYSPTNLGHAGLGSARYCHFTSPIRRYPDLVAHRALLQGLGIDDAATPAHELDDAGIESSAAERAAMEIERDADDVCRAFLLERTLSELDPADPPAFAGEVVGLIPAGAFVRFGDEGFEGMLPVRRLRGWWELNELGTALVAADSGRELRLGDALEVAVDRVDAPRGRVDLVPAA